MFVEREKVLKEILTLNNENNPWTISIEENKIIATWKWMDAKFFSFDSITDEIKEYTFEVVLEENGKWKELDKHKKKDFKIDFRTGNISFGKSKFQGKSIEKSFTIGIGKDKQINHTGVVKFSLDTNTIKKPIRNFLKQHGWKKQSLF